MEVIDIKQLPQDNQVIEAFKSLRTNIQFCGADIKVIAITSCEPNEGKTLVSFNLAQALAESGKRVIYIEADLRKSSFLGKFRAVGEVNGLSHYLSGQCKLDQIIYATNVKHLYATFAGPIPPNPAELLSRNHFGEQINALRDTFDYVIIDTPPLGRVIDCAVIAPNCDGIALVVSSGEAGLKYIKSVKKQIEKTGCPLLGVILNKVNMSGRGYYGKYSYNYGK